MIHLSVRNLRPGDVFIRQDSEAARIVSIRQNTHTNRVDKIHWEIKTATGYTSTDNPKKTSISVDETNRFLLKVEIFGDDQEFHAYGGEMNLHKDQIVLVVERGAAERGTA